MKEDFYKSRLTKEFGLGFDTTRIHAEKAVELALHD